MGMYSVPSPGRGASARRRRGTVVATLLIAAACGGDAAPADDAGPVRVAESAVHVLGTSDAISQVRDLAVLQDGSVWALNAVEPFFVGFGPDGDLLAAHGAAGGGPEEFRMPAAFTTGGDGAEAWVLDFIRHALIRVSRPGEWAQISIPQEEIPAGSLRGGMDLMTPTVRTARLGREFVLPRTTGSLADGLTSFRMAILGADLVALEPGTGAVRTVVRLGEALDDPSEGFTATEGGFPLWYRLWATCGDDQIRVYDRARNQLRGFSAQGQELEAVQLPPLYPTEVTPRAFAGVVFPLRQAEVTGGVGSRLTAQDSLRVINEIVQGVTGQPSDLAAYLPRFVDFRCADDGTMWLQPLDLDAGGLRGGGLWYRVTPRGDVREVHFPDRFDAMRFSPNRVWGVQRNQVDVASVAWIDLPEGLGGA